MWKKWLIILGTLPILVILAGVYKFNYLASQKDYDIDGNKIKKELGYYEKLKQKCNRKNSKNCCLASVERMQSIGAKLAENDKCKKGHRRELMMCIDSFVWCEKEKNDGDEVDKKMIIKIPTWEFDEKKDDFLVTFKEYEVREDPAILRETLKKLFEVKGGDSREAWNGLKFDSVSIKDGMAIVKLSGNWYPVGDMSGAYFSHEIEAAIFQFTNIENLRVLVNEEIFDWCIDSEAEPEESGCDKNKILWDTSLKK